MIKTVVDFAPEHIKQPFMKEYVEPLMNLIRLVFIKFNEINDRDIYAQIDAFMTRNEARLGMDRGNPKYLNMGWKQVYNRNPIEDVPVGEKTDDILLHWMADVYTYWQWAYNIPSPEINKRCNARQLKKEYDVLHVTGLSTACRKLTEKYFPDITLD